MVELINILQTIGDITLANLWFPLIVWTVIALPITILLHRTDRIPPVYQYHSRMALLLALPLGIAGSYLIEMLGKALASSQAVAAKFIVVPNPISISATNSQTTPWNSLSDPMLWIGLTTIFLAIGAIYYLLRFIYNSIQLKQLAKNLEFNELPQVEELKISIGNNPVPNLNPLIAFSEHANIPFTYGWINTKIVIPAELKEDPDKMGMAIRHELMHIKHKDFLLNGMLLVLKALFWFHPLIHHLYNSSQEFREITCDGEVLSDNQFSKKRYAALLYELAEREYKNSNLARSMAVNPSSLKKRIQIMSTQNITPSSFRSSFLLTLVTASLVILTISCSDITDNGITNSEFQQAQVQMSANPDAKERPLYVLNGEQVTETDPPDALSRIKSKYIKSINVLKNQKALDKYGEAGRNGVLEIQFLDDINKETVFSDLKEAPTPPPPTGPGGTDSNSPDSPESSPPSPEEEYFVAVEQMPELVGGLESLFTKIRYPEEAREAGDEGRVIIRFIVNEEGEVEDPEVIRGVSESLDEEALRVVKEAEFKPGTQRGKPVRVQYSLPIIFRIQGNDNTSQELSGEDPENIQPVNNNLDSMVVNTY
ncbi:M56 family metallopeptidase [Aliifodinibius salicampi]|uniref:M56 family metallopeptidase n=1 Tax=Fodinibius salicampi TaxID=1920655 RepID=A0ABT3PU21_9BACT|nr:M56 family metallopeptidase [Fodinibius salicampi]MCW9711323.1 M56 family metallopeptidase [Fodinibius salicampi]